METINNLASTASKAIWGDQSTKKDNETNGKEPVSGELGNVKAGEPYDKGNAEPTSEPKSLTKSTSREVFSADSTADLPSTAAHHPTLTEPVRGKQDDKTEAATQAALVNLEKNANDTTVGSSTADKSQGDGLVSAKKVGEGEGAHTGVKPDLGAPVSKEPIGVKDTSEKTLGTTTDSTAATKANTTGTSNTTTTGSSSTPAAKETSPRKSTSSNSSHDKDGKKKVSLKEKIKAKLHHHKH